MPSPTVMRDRQPAAGAPDSLGDRVRRLRQKRGLSQDEVARAINVERLQISRWETEAAHPRQASIKRLAAFFGVPERWLSYGGEGGPQFVTIIGDVGAGAAVFPIEDGAFDQIETPFAAPPDTVALCIRGDSMLPELADGDVVIYRARATNPGDCIGKRCVVRLEDGRALVKRLRRGSGPGLWTLDSTNASAIEDVEIVWCAPIWSVIYR